MQLPAQGARGGAAAACALVYYNLQGAALFSCLAAALPFIISPVCLFCGIYGYPSGDVRNRIKGSSILSGRQALHPEGFLRQGPSTAAASLGTARFNSSLAEQLSGREE